MFFYLSKIAWLLAQPISVVALLIGLALIFGLLSRRRLSVVAMGLALVVQFVVGFTSLGFVLIQPLEDRVPRPTTPPRDVGAIIMLGGATLGRVSTARQIAELNEAGDRLTETLWLANRYPEAQIYLSGGSSVLAGETESEAVVVRRFLVAHGVEEARIVLEENSRNTDENAEFTVGMLRAIEGQTILVTSAFHMPRAMGLFRKQGFEPVPWPTDYRSSGREQFGIDIANPVQNLNVATVAIKEWIGLAAYHRTGRIDELFPGP